MSRLGSFVRRYLPGLLVACYAIAALVPGPGAAMRAWELPELLPRLLRPSLPMLLVAVLLLAAAVGVELPRLRQLVRRPGLTLACLAAVWVVPLVLVGTIAVVCSGLTTDPAHASLLLGLGLVAAMPVANSSAAWTQQSGGDLTWSLGLVVLSILLCPLATPLALHALDPALPAEQAEPLARLTLDLSGGRFVVWVLVPAGAGVALRRLLGGERADRNRDAFALLSAAALLLLNYMNAAVALPEMIGDPRPGLLLAALVAVVVLSLAGYATAGALARGFKLSAPGEAAIGFGLGMKHTGLALALASAMLAEQPLLLLPIVAMTLVQHVVASVAHRWFARRIAAQGPGRAKG